MQYSAVGQQSDVSSPDLAELLPSGEPNLRAERRSPATIKVYGDWVRRFLAWCDETPAPRPRRPR